MQLILDADNIDIERNMSTIDQEPLNEKFLTNKVIDHLTDDVTTGNKENIQKQENIILDVGEDNIVDSDKEISASGVELVTNNFNVDKSNEDTLDTDDVQTPREIIEGEITINNLEPVSDSLTTEHGNKDESLWKKNDSESEKIHNKDVTEIEPMDENESDLLILDKNVDDTVSVKETGAREETTENNEQENEIDELDKEVDISELSTELNEETEMDKDVEIAEIPITVDKNNDTEVDDTIDTVTKSELEIECGEKVVPKTSLENKIQDTECSEIESGHINNTNEENIAIEIDDEEEKPSEKGTQSNDNSEKIFEDNGRKDVPKVTEEFNKCAQEDISVKKIIDEPVQPKRVCRLSNNLDIFSDEEDDHPNEEPPKDKLPPQTEKPCIDIDDDDDIMLVDEDSSAKENKQKDTSTESNTNAITDDLGSQSESNNLSKNEVNTTVETEPVTETTGEPLPSETDNKDNIASTNETTDVPVIDTNKMTVDKVEETEKSNKPLLPKNFINTCKKNLSDMTRNDLEEFCILRIVESIVDRSSLGEIKAHLKNLTQTMEECKKKCLMLTKQNKDLQVVLKSVQEEQKSGSDVHITPLKITRSVGMQVMMVADKNNLRKKPINGVGSQAPVPNNNNNTKQVKNQINQNNRNQKEKPLVNQQIPVPRLVPATPPAAKSNQAAINSTATKQVNNAALPNGIRNSPPMLKVAEKRARSQAVTVDLTDDEPPAKLQNVQRGPINQQMRVLTATPNLIPPQRFNQNMNSPRKVYIPISGPQAQNVRPGQTIMLKTLSGLGPRPRAQAQALITKAPQTPSPVRFARGQPNRHPAPLPDAMKQYQPPNWKALPPAPDLKLSKVENGIVISWKIDGYQEDNHEEIASYQLYAYQETSSPPNTALWKKIGDVKALPLPMACTLTQFMAGYKYYFAVRAVDIRSRFGPFSLPGSILLLNKM